MSNKTKTTERHAALAKIVTGEIINAIKSHPEIVIPENVRWSMAKRITSQVLANWEMVGGMPNV